MAIVRVWNDSQYDHSEKFKGKTIQIAAGGFLEMEADDAVLFKSQFTPIIKDKHGQSDPRFHKRIRIEFDPVSTPAASRELESKTCVSCGFVAKSAAGLTAHVRASHLNQMVDEEAKKALANS